MNETSDGPTDEGRTWPVAAVLPSPLRHLDVGAREMPTSWVPSAAHCR
jgi:hypothetical protein